MPNATVEERLATVEDQLAKVLKSLDLKSNEKEPVAWWENWLGAFKDNPDFDEAMRLGEEYRKAQPNAEDNPEAIDI